jgi:PLP dependent protein
MTIPPLAEDPEKARPFFRRLRGLRDAWAAETGMELAELSMGMTHDLEVAIEEGATFVRVGTGIFGARAKPAKEADEA